MVLLFSIDCKFYFIPMPLYIFNYLVNDYKWIFDYGIYYNIFGVFTFPTVCSTWCSSFAKFPVIFGNPCPLKISDVATIYDYSSLKRSVALPLLFLAVLSLTTSLTHYFFTYPFFIRFHSCFRELHFSGGKNILRVKDRVWHETPNFSTISAYGDLTIMFL